MIGAFAAIATLAMTQVELRGGEPAPPGEVVGVDAQGVTLGTSAGEGRPPRPAVILAWDRVRSIFGPGSGEFESFRADADRAWRARTRLERGDAIAAEPLFEELFARHRAQRGATAAVVAEGLLRCRLRRGAHGAAFEAWLATLAATEPGPTPILHADWSLQAGLPPVIDASTGLVPAIPPIWVGPSAAQVLGGQAPWPGSEAPLPTTKPAMLASLYLAAARFEAGEAVTLPQIDSTDPGVQWVRQIVQSRVGDASQRDAARTALVARLSPRPSANGTPSAEWIEVWTRAAIGRSLIREPSTEQKQLGIIELLHVPARLSSVHPYLAGTCLAEAAVTLADLGDRAGAARLAAELARDHPTHPVLDWPPVRTLIRASPPPSPPRS